MNKPDAIFLSASVPKPGRGHFHENADPWLIQSAVRALVSVVLGRRHLVWGGHPAITPMVRVTADNLGVDVGRWVHLYQSAFFQNEFPEDNKFFPDTTVVEAGIDRDSSLEKMRRQMLDPARWNFQGAVFIGGMEGVFEELKIFQELHPTAVIVPVAAPGGAAKDIYEDIRNSLDFAGNSLDFTGLFYEALAIDPLQSRG